jgi:hypothetical protein
MEKLIVPYLNCYATNNIQEISFHLNKLERHPLEHMLWSEASYKPRIVFSIAYSDASIFLKYYVQEKAIRITHNTDNSPVYQDSCVEFFISFNNEKEYYNLEFNCIGTCAFEFGKGKLDRQSIPREVTSKIKRQSIVESRVEDEIAVINWELTLVIPLEAFIYHPITSLKGFQCKGNFYKCGDALPEPHFLAWQEIQNETPNFHLPEFFGNMQFV